MEPDLLVPDALRVDLAALRRRAIDQHELEAVLPVEWLAKALHDTDATVTTAGHVRLRLLLQPEGVVVAQGSLQVAFAVPCGRCLELAPVDGSAEIFATFMAAPDEAPPADDEEGDLDPDDATPDVYRYDEPILRLHALVAEQVALAYPMRVLCNRGEACRGLCSNCGFELNALPGTERRCPQCHNEVPLTPVADLPSAGAGEGTDPDETPAQRDAREGEGPLAAALRKLQLD